MVYSTHIYQCDNNWNWNVRCQIHSKECVLWVSKLNCALISSLLLQFSSLQSVCVCVSVGESVHVYVSSHAYVWAHKHHNEAISAERDSKEAVRVCSHIWAFLRDFTFPSPDCASSACLCKGCLKSLIILYKPKDQGSVLRVSSGAHHFVWGISKLSFSALHHER